MKVRRKKKKPPEGVDVEVDVLVRGVKVTHQTGAIVATNVRKAMAEAIPGSRIRGLWVHEDVARQVDRSAAVKLILESLGDEAEADPSVFVLRAQELARKLQADG